MTTTNDSGVGPSFSRLRFTDKTTDNDEAIANLTEQLVDLKKKRYEERFAWILGFLILIDLWLFPSMETWGAPVSILVLEVVLLLLLGRKWGIPDIGNLVDMILASMRSRNHSE